MLLAPLLVAGLIAVDRRRVHFVLTAALLLLFTLSTPLSRLVCYAWPGMCFRHIGLVSSLVKVLFCFVAGIGFEFLFKANAWKRAAIRAVAVLGAIGLGTGAWWAMNTASSTTALNRYVSSITVDEPARSLHVFDRGELARRLRQGAGWAMTGAAVLTVGALFRTSQRNSTRVRDAVSCAVLAFVAIDLYQFKFMPVRSERRHWPRAISRGGTVADAVFIPPRVGLAGRGRRGAFRLTDTIAFNLLRRRLEGQHYGSHYWTSNALWFVDEVNDVSGGFVARAARSTCSDVSPRHRRRLPGRAKRQ